MNNDIFLFSKNNTQRRYNSAEGAFRQAYDEWQRITTNKGEMGERQARQRLSFAAQHLLNVAREGRMYGIINNPQSESLARKYEM